jgi:3-hydroxyacyl-[acyl-carrier-protein] dehydratase
MDKTKLSASVAISKDDQWFSGHFPENPILPGIAQIKLVVDLISGCTSKKLQVTGLNRVKFRKIITPGELLDIRVNCVKTDEQYTFQITSGSDDVCSGKVFFTPLKQN